jgi:hypothetical protein
VLGFNVLRRTAGGAFEAVNSELILATYAGQSGGAVYSLVDPASAGTYRLEVVRLDGSVEAYGDVSVAQRR